MTNEICKCVSCGFTGLRLYFRYCNTNQEQKWQRICTECYKTKTAPLAIRNDIVLFNLRCPPLKQKKHLTQYKNTLPNQAQIELEQYLDYFIDLYRLTIRY